MTIRFSEIKKGGLSHGLIGGIVVIVIVAITLVSAMLFYLRRRWQNGQLPSNMSEEEEVVRHPRHPEYIIEPFVSERRPPMHQASFSSVSSPSYARIDGASSPKSTGSKRARLSPGVTLDGAQTIPWVSSSPCSAMKYESYSQKPVRELTSNQ